ncbi:NAD-binding protein [Cyclobacterium marinum]|uniref:RCK N-terminal domain-containing protein n=1 Tax=Cyclobacterium marinum (strain ATCC 25205 / DSM 745 / LMG 13164 / NCIMB 1802) TaxID=880070 RepID=G0IYZ5_CYCMS|nr:NAD-binding protein [Cyclobacterium marinum]AEL28140.1 hypothetical protein Cycma_4438 [Cyclobacterium marinum DSM 745]
MHSISSQEFKRLLKNKTVIGHSGHQDILINDIPAIREKVHLKLEEIVNGKPENFILITGFAKGADELVANQAASLGVVVILLIIDEKIFPSYGQGDLERVDKLESKENYTILKIKPLKSDRDQTPYEILNEILTFKSSHLITLWDGIDTGKLGGTWHAVKKFKNKSSAKSFFWDRKVQYTLHHLYTAREKNAIPSAQSYLNHPIIPRSKHDWETTIITAYYKNLITKACKRLPRFGRNVFPISTGIFLRFLLPLFLVCCVLVLGVTGHYGIEEKTWNEFLNSIFFSANLITLDGSIFDKTYNWQVQVARILGGSFTVVVFFIALYFASGKEVFYRFLFFKFRLWNRFKGGVSAFISWVSFRNLNPKWTNSFAVVVGLNEMAYDILKDLRNPSTIDTKGVKVVVLNPDPSSAFVGLARNEGAWIIDGMPTNSASLKKTYFQKALQVFVVTNCEEENVRCVMELDQMISNIKKHKNEDWFVHIQDRKLKQLLQQSISGRTNYALTVFSHADNTARRMFAGFPELRETPLSFAITIVGFGSLGRSLALKSIQQLVFSKFPLPRILVFYPYSDAKAVEDFKKEYPYLFKESENHKDINFNRVMDWTFYGEQDEGSTSDRINFYPLPLIPQQLTHPHSPLIRYLSYFKKLKFFSCLHSGLESASILTSILPGLERIKLENPNYDLQAYCFYNFPDEKEEVYLEQKINALAPHIPVKCFGNYLYEFSCKAIQNKEADHLAKQIALWYYLLYDYGNRSVRTSLEVEKWFTKLISKVKALKVGYVSNNEALTYDEELKHKIDGLKNLWFQALSDSYVLEGMEMMMRYCWKSLSETDREGNRQAADHLWIKVTAYGKKWVVSDQVPEKASFEKFWSKKEVEDLGLIEHRRWNAMKILDGWRPFVGKDWKTYKETYKAQKLHNLLVTFNDLPANEQFKDYHQIEGIPYFISLMYLDQYGNQILI